MTTTVESLLNVTTPGIARALQRPLEGLDLQEEGVVSLFNAAGTDVFALLMAADYLRRESVGEVVTYVVNRNINFTNVCIKRCGFCAFSRTYRSSEGYYLDDEEIVRRAREAQHFGASE